MAYTINQTFLATINPPAGADFPDAAISLTPAPKSRSYQNLAFFPLTNYVGAVNTAVAIPTATSWLYARVTGGMLTLKITTAAGAAQIIPVDDLFLYSNATNSITALTVSGTGVLELCGAGN